jgi:hypothetical protein
MDVNSPDRKTNRDLVRGRCEIGLERELVPDRVTNALFMDL